MVSLRGTDTPRPVQPLAGLKTRDITLLFNRVNHLLDPGNPRESTPMARWRPRFQV